MEYISGKMIKELREARKMTQRELADMLLVSDKTISKWETQKGMPDISLVSTLAAALGVSVAELFAGEYAVNRNKSANMKKTGFYICPICGNVVVSAGEGNYNCCGITLLKEEAEKPDEHHEIICEEIENEYYVHVEHPMNKEHSISFVAYVTADRVSVVKQYPEQEVSCRFLRRGHGFLYIYCNHHGLFCKRI